MCDTLRYFNKRYPSLCPEVDLHLFYDLTLWWLHTVYFSQRACIGVVVA